MQSITRSVHLALAGLLVGGLAVQVFLAGLGVFRGAASFETHRDFGYMLEILPLTLLIVGLIARLGRRPAILAAVILGQFVLQSVFVALRTDAPEVAALHPVNGFLITFLAIVLARDSWIARRAATTESTATT